MPVISQADIDDEIRLKCLEEYRDSLRKSLMNPGLTGEQRRSIKATLAGLGKPKEYREDSPPPPGAIEVPV
jgi:hypothetical protein